VIVLRKVIVGGRGDGKGNSTVVALSNVDCATLVAISSYPHPTVTVEPGFFHYYYATVC
jgi:hypothetical protein